MKILPVTQYNNSNQIAPPKNNQSFCGMTKAFKRKVYIDGKKDILELIHKRKPSQNTLVGQLPQGIFDTLKNNVSKKELTPSIKEIMNTFGEIACLLRHRNDTVNANKKLQDIALKFKLAADAKDINLEYIGRGDYGKVYKINGLQDHRTNDDLILKVHHKVDKGPDWHRYKSHGCFAEINTAEYWSNLWKQDTQRGKFYFADIDNGFMVDNFIDQTTPKYKKYVNEYTAGLKLTDEELAFPNGHNKINGFSIDWGGVRVVNRVKNESKTARKVLSIMKQTLREQREIKWFELLDSKKFDDVQKKAGLALSIKHLPDNKKEFYIEKCLGFNKPFVDQALSYVLKYLPHEHALKYYETLMKRNNEVTQTILMNEIPLLARKPLPEAYDDLDIPKDQIMPEKIKEFYDISKRLAADTTREHLASYVHLLPEEHIKPEFESLVKLDNYETYDRLLHKIRIVPDMEFPFDLRFDMLKRLQTAIKDPYLSKHCDDIRIQTIRKTLED